MFQEGSEYPIFVPVDGIVATKAARNDPANAIVLAACDALDVALVMVVQDPESGEDLLVFPRGAFGEKNMEKSVFWALKTAEEKMKTAYMDLEELPDEQAEVKAMIKRLHEIVYKVDKLVVS